ncbi:RES domain-containing protein [Baekduia soli]|uniref:RES domain-containing protein n=1 Tax=Baekduia soli TaxID=496014 RepID=A0A5B8U8I0_9ACTN|nr:RES family NAD+ phosphorylase [Baekduia soli]QEC49221.1 RES domain-containing protein [Baekduia soli]
MIDPPPLAISASRPLATRLEFVWRVGHVDGPFGYPPRAVCSWNSRFDDPQHQYRTIYAADHRLTCLREVLAPLRPNLKARAEFAELQHAQGIAAGHRLSPAGEVTRVWRQNNVLVAGRVARSGHLVDLRERRLMEQLASAHALLLAAHDLLQLDVSEITSSDREITQNFSRDLYDKGASGLRFASALDTLGCVVLFEGRARLRPTPVQTPLTNAVPELLQVCSEFSLVLRQ